MWPVPLQNIVAFIVFMFKSGLAHSTVSCYISGLSFHTRINEFDDNTQKFVVKKLIDGNKRSKSPQKDSRLPITMELLVKILSVLPIVCSSHYESEIFTAAYALAYYGLFRVGELTVDSMGTQTGKSHTVQVGDAKIVGDTLEIYLATSKTDQSGKGVSIHISAQANKTLCPVFNLKKFLNSRPLFGGPLVCHFDGNPLTRYQFAAILKKSLSLLGVDYSHMTSHSFRIGMATTCVIAGIPDEHIKTLGRWKSGAYLRYIRILF